MKTMKQGSRLYRLISVLAVSGEYPVKSLYLLGNQRMYRKLVQEGLKPTIVRNSETGEKISLPRIFNLCGRGRNKTIRLYAGAFPVLTWLGEGEYYESITHGYSLPMNQSHIDRNHRVAEALAVCMDAGIEILPHNLPRLRLNSHHGLITPGQSFFLTSRAIKQIGGTDDESQKTNFTRMVGGLFAGNHCYAVFNTRDSVMKWSGGGEIKAQINLEIIWRANAHGGQRIDSAIFFGVTPEVAMASIEATKKISRKEFRFDSIFLYAYYAPLGEYGARFLRLFTVPNWKEKILRSLFKNETRSFNCGSFEYDACIETEKGKRYVMSFLDGDLVRLKRHKEAIMAYTDVTSQIICFPWMIPFVKKYMEGLNTEILYINLEEMEEELSLT